jgi:glycosyltransferase involved in cell wall biosynthesis
MEMKILHLTSSRFFGGPERQMLGLATAGRELFATSFASFSENGLCREFLGRAKSSGFPAIELANDTPHLLQAVREIRQLIRDQGIDVLLCHGYKAGLFGWRAARRAGKPVVAVSRGWTGENRKVQFYEWLDKKVLKQLDRVVCVSAAQADKVRRCGVDERRIAVIPNSIDISRFRQPAEASRSLLESLWNPECVPMANGQASSSGEEIARVPGIIVGAAGRLSPEKGFDLFVAAARQVVDACPNSGFVLFGEGPLRSALAEQIERAGLTEQFLLAGFQPEFDKYLPGLDLFVQSSHTEGMPNVILEALASGVPVAATAVGGTVEIIEDGVNGELVSPGSADALTRAIVKLVRDPSRRMRYTQHGRHVIASRFGFKSQAEEYGRLFQELTARPVTCSAAVAAKENLATAISGNDRMTFGDGHECR